MTHHNPSIPPNTRAVVDTTENPKDERSHT
jgi:hypothetical protein